MLLPPANEVVSVILSTGTGVGITGPMSFLGMSISATRSMAGGWYVYRSGYVRGIGIYPQGEGWACPRGRYLLGESICSQSEVGMSWGGWYVQGGWYV